MSSSHLSLLMLVLTPLMASNVRPAETISRDMRHPPLTLMTLLAPHVPPSQIRALYPWVIQSNGESYYPLSAGYRHNIAFRPAIGQQPAFNNEVVESRIGFALLLFLLLNGLDDRFDSSATAQQSISYPSAADFPAFPMWPPLNRPRM